MSSDKTNNHNPFKDEEIELFDKQTFLQIRTDICDSEDRIYQDALSIEYQGMLSASVSKSGMFADTKQSLHFKTFQKPATGSAPRYPLSPDLQAELDNEIKFKRSGMK
jgi:hypothetical protein